MQFYQSKGFISNLALNAIVPINHASQFCQLKKLLVVGIFSSIDRVLKLSAVHLILVHPTWLKAQILNCPIHNYGFYHIWC